MDLSFTQKVIEDQGYSLGSPNTQKISSSNDFGYTTGPWKYYANTLKDDPLAKGHFITVWHLNNNGVWKFLIDFGINYNLEQKKMALKKAKPEKKMSKKYFQQSLKEAEEKFIQSYKTQGKKAYSSFLSSNKPTELRRLFTGSKSW
jgi:hypothetical protein